MEGITFHVLQTFYEGYGQSVIPEPLKQQKADEKTHVKSVVGRFSAKHAFLFLVKILATVWRKLASPLEKLSEEVVLKKFDCRAVRTPRELLVTPATPLARENLLQKEFPQALNESEFSRDMALVAVLPGVAAVLLIALQLSGIETIFTPKFDWSLVYALAALPVVFWTGVVVFCIGMKLSLSKEDFKDQIVKCNNTYHHFVTSLAYVCFLAFNVIYFQYFWLGWTLSTTVWMVTAAKDWANDFKNQPGPHEDTFDGNLNMPELFHINGVEDLKENKVVSEGAKAGTEAENWSMATKFIPLYLFLILRVLLVPNVWINVISRIFLHHFHMNFSVYEFDYDEQDYSELCCEWILETCVGVYVKSVDLENETAEWFMHNVVLSEFENAEDTKGQVKVYPGLSIKLDLANKRVISSELRDIDSRITNITNQDLFNILVWLLLTRVHHKIHAGSVWNLDYESESIVRRIQSATTVFYNNLGWNNPAFMSGLCGNSALDVINVENALGEAFLTNMFSKLSYHQEIRKLRKYSDMVNFLVCIRNDLKTPCVFSNNGKSKDQGEGVFLSAMHAIDHHALNKVVPTDACFGNHWKWKGMADHNRAVFIMQTDDNPLVVYPHKYNSPWATARQKHIYKMAYRINPELADELETCVIR